MGENMYNIQQNVQALYFGADVANPRSYSSYLNYSHPIHRLENFDIQVIFMRLRLSTPAHIRHLTTCQQTNKSNQKFLPLIMNLQH